MDWCEECYRNLAVAIVKRAILDYGDIVGRQIMTNKNMIPEIAHLEQFFRSEYFELLCNLDGETVIKSCSGQNCEKYFNKLRGKARSL